MEALDWLKLAFVAIATGFGIYGTLSETLEERVPKAKDAQTPGSLKDHRPRSGWHQLSKKAKLALISTIGGFLGTVITTYATDQRDEAKAHEAEEARRIEKEELNAQRDSLFKQAARSIESLETVKGQLREESDSGKVRFAASVRSLSQVSSGLGENLKSAQTISESVLLSQLNITTSRLRFEIRLRYGSACQDELIEQLMAYYASHLSSEHDFVVIESESGVLNLLSSLSPEYQTQFNEIDVAGGFMVNENTSRWDFLHMFLDPGLKIRAVILFEDGIQINYEVPIKTNMFSSTERVILTDANGTKPLVKIGSSDFCGWNYSAVDLEMVFENGLSFHFGEGGEKVLESVDFGTWAELPRIKNALKLVW